MTERRTKRSADPLVALHYQLAQAREDARCEVLVLAERGGFVVAGAGSWPACEELAAYAPLLAATPEEGASVRVEAMRAEIEVVPVVVDGEEMFLVARGGRRRTSVAPAAEGVTRILTRAA